MPRFTIILILFALLCFSVYSRTADSAPSESNIKVETAKEQQEEKPKSQKEEFNDLCDKFFKKHVDNDGMVDYADLRRKRIGLIEITNLLKDMHMAEAVIWSDDPEISEKERICFWVNTHNILTLKLIIDNYPLQKAFWEVRFLEPTIKWIPGGRAKTYFKIMELEYTLLEIETDLLKQMKDPRICFALCYSSVSGAKLRNEAYRPEKIEAQLEEQTKKFLANKQNLSIENAKETLEMSALFIMNKTVFLDSQFSEIKRFRDKKNYIKAYLNFIYKHGPKDIVDFIGQNEFEVEFKRYDWKLNDK